jgi:hypothetical protein
MNRQYYSWFSSAKLFFHPNGTVVVVHITLTKVVSSNTTQGEVYSIQHYVTKFVNDLWQVGGFLRVL